MAQKALSVVTIAFIAAAIIGLFIFLTDMNTPASFRTGSGVRGTVTIGPTCPVERIPPDPRCADRPYQGQLVIKSQDRKISLNVLPDANGMFERELPPGDYTIGPSGNVAYPRAGTQTFTVLPNRYTEVTIQFDSGIR